MRAFLFAGRFSFPVPGCSRQRFVQLEQSWSMESVNVSLVNMGSLNVSDNKHRPNPHA